MMNAPTVHIGAKKDDIADIVLMPGDPLRAKYIAENYLSNVVCINEIRGMLGYTGYYKNKRVTVMGSGMGIPSMGIYCYELFKFYNVDKIIRIGSCGSYSDDLELLDIIVVDKAYTESSFAYAFNNSNEKIVSSSEELTNMIINVSEKNNLRVHKGNVLTSDCFDWYIDLESLLKRLPKEVNCIGAEMEAFALLYTAKVLNKQAACVLSVVDSHTKNTLISSEDREKSLKNMIELVLESVI